METWLDLHMHTRYSMDGQFEPADLMQQCADAGLRAVAVTDHDSVRAIPEAKEMAQRLGLYFFPGIEVSCQHNGKNFHLLGYGIHTDCAVFQQIEKDIHEQRLANSEKMMDAVEALGIYLDRPQIRNMSLDGVVASVTIARAALADPRNENNIVLAPYRPGGTRGNAPYVNFGWDFCGQGGPAFIPMELPDFAASVQVIQQHGGAAVLAHPGANMKQNRELTEELIQCGIDGIEVFCSYHDKETAAFYRHIVQEHQLLDTIGSDYHGRTKPHISLGTYGHPQPQPVYEGLCEIIKKRNGEVY